MHLKGICLSWNIYAHTDWYLEYGYQIEGVRLIYAVDEFFCAAESRI